MLTDTFTHYYGEEIIVTGFGSCHLTLLLVGGGGAEGNYFSGAGSGFLEYRSIDVSAGTVLTAFVGDMGERTRVEISGGETISASAGGISDSSGVHDGGIGYCGGGGGGRNSGYAGAGGTNGGNGGGGSDSSGGHGTGEDISRYTFTTWTITPGAGGEVFHANSGGMHHGGGGGGILVDGKGPFGLWSVYRGEGYGGGGGGISMTSPGQQGVILMEIK